MNMKKLDKSVLKLWYSRAVIISLVLIGMFASVAVILIFAEAPSNVMLAILLGAGSLDGLLLFVTLIMPILRYKMYSWGYDDRRIIVKQGVIFRQSVVIPICQIQDLHQTQGPIMMAFSLSDVTISTAGSNFNISTLTTVEAEALIDDLESILEARLEEQKNEKI